MPALSLLESERQDSCLAPLSLGCPALDALLSGGVPRRGITELAGESGSGKTQLCLQMALESARATGHGEGCLRRLIVRVVLEGRCVGTLLEMGER